MTLAESRESVPIVEDIARQPAFPGKNLDGLYRHEKEQFETAGNIITITSAERQSAYDEAEKLLKKLATEVIEYAGRPDATDEKTRTLAENFVKNVSLNQREYMPGADVKELAESIFRKARVGRSIDATSSLVTEIEQVQNRETALWSYLFTARPDLITELEPFIAVLPEDVLAMRAAVPEVEAITTDLTEHKKKRALKLGRVTITASNHFPWLIPQMSHAS